EVRDLRLARRVVVVEIEPRFAEAHNLLVLALLEQRLGRRQRLDRGLMRMDAHGAMDVGRAFGDRPHAWKSRKPRSDRQEVPHTLRARGTEHAVDLAGEVGKVEMAVAVDKHGPNLSDWKEEFKRGERVGRGLESRELSSCGLLERGRDAIQYLGLAARLFQLGRCHSRIIL